MKMKTKINKRDLIKLMVSILKSQNVHPRPKQKRYKDGKIILKLLNKWKQYNKLGKLMRRQWEIIVNHFSRSIGGIKFYKKVSG